MEIIEKFLIVVGFMGTMSVAVIFCYLVIDSLCKARKCFRDLFDADGYRIYKYTLAEDFNEHSRYVRNELARLDERYKELIDRLVEINNKGGE